MYLIRIQSAVNSHRSPRLHRYRSDSQFMVADVQRHYV